MTDLEKLEVRIRICEMQLENIVAYANPRGRAIRLSGGKTTTDQVADKDCDYCTGKGYVRVPYDDIYPGQEYKIDSYGKPTRHCPICMGGGKSYRQLTDDELNAMKETK